MRVCPTIACAALWLAAPSAMAQADPYAGAYAEQKVRAVEGEIDALAKNIEILYFAAACKVVNVLIIDGIAGTEGTDLVMRSGLRFDQVGGASRSGMLPALARAKKIGTSQALVGCEYWTDHPENVFIVRQTIAAWQAGH